MEPQTALPPRQSRVARGVASCAVALRALGITQALVLAAFALRAALAPREQRLALAARALGVLKGPFAKLGQLAALRVDVMAPEARAALLALRDDVPPLPASWIRGEIERALGAPLARHFARLDARPLGAASIAQVHAAQLRGGGEVAVKVQYPWLARSLRADLALARLALRVVTGARVDDATWREFARGFESELDFAREANSAREIAANLAAEKNVVVPRVIADASAKRVLAMERIATIPLSREALLARGIAPTAVVEIVLRAYARQIFLDGVFHADPHAGNLFVIDEPSAAANPRVLFVDFGLSQRLTTELRRELRAGILALLNNQLDEFLAAMQRMRMIEPGAEPAVRDAVGAMLTRLRGEGGNALALSGERVLALKDEAQTLLYATPGLTLPPDLLLYAKTVSTVFALSRDLAPEVDPMKLAAPYLLRFLAQRE
ncbi:MAG: AarF/ABC1/UbiB kinase family protein [Deltaproteobacteria bacterium]|nr:AarF/ABC1/UbiB kinase family protein [Deltaproteobacteria bacterium]